MICLEGDVRLFLWVALFTVGIPMGALYLGMIIGMVIKTTRSILKD